MNHLSSKDGGVTWSDSKKYFDDKGIFIRNRIIRRKDQTLLIPYYSTNGGASGINGKVGAIGISKSKTVPDSGKDWDMKVMDQFKDLEQPTCWRQPHDHSTIECYFRDCGQKSIYAATSKDEGHSFSDPQPIQLKNPGSGIEGAPLSNGDLVLMYNPTTDDKRDPLSAGISSDDGKTWKSREIQNGPTGVPNLGKNEFAYPTVLQTPDGTIHTMYTYGPEGQLKTIKYAKFTEDWVTK